MHERAEDAGSVAGLLEALRLGLEQARKARGQAGTNGHGQAVASDRGGVNPGLALLDGEVVDQKARFKIIRAVQNDVEACQQLGGVAGTKVRNDAFHGHTGVDGAEFAFGSHRFGKGRLRVFFVEEGLPLKIGRLDKIAVDNADASDAGTNQEVCGGGADGAASDDDRGGSKQTLLAFLANVGKEHLTRVFFAKRLVHLKGWPLRTRVARPCL
jgi:hypothetical protein